MTGENGTSAVGSSRGRSLERRINRKARRGWTWVASQLQSFRPGDLHDPNQIKPLSELALVYSLVARSESASGFGALHAVERFLVGEFEGARLAAYAGQAPALYNPYIMAYLPLRALGYRFERFERAIGIARRSGYPRSLELVPHRKLELEYILERAFGSPKRSVSRRPDRGTVLGSCRTPVYLMLDDVYSVTHTLFYA